MFETGQAIREDLPKPFKLEEIQRIDETPVHKAVREAFVNLLSMQIFDGCRNL